MLLAPLPKAASASVCLAFSLRFSRGMSRHLCAFALTFPPPSVSLPSPLVPSVDLNAGEQTVRVRVTVPQPNAMAGSVLPVRRDHEQPDACLCDQLQGDCPGNPWVKGCERVKC